ncbi:hypothetical protein D9613_004067 [Agrocybe pediades]|uniref:Uncharacterized protein n=1 Tax=Agrocybe pediades TaxID=84607 RepID=A0A8H4VKW6_9AGAR|nr:hypothetical protein D9613_004067 [Agrocybe pediades]
MDDFFSILLCEDITATTAEQTSSDQSLESHASGDVDPPGVLADFERGFYMTDIYCQSTDFIYHYYLQHSANDTHLPQRHIPTHCNDTPFTATIHTHPLNLYPLIATTPSPATIPIH